MHFLLSVLLIACQTSSTKMPEETPICAASVQSTYPVMGATDVYYTETVEFTLSAPDSSATIVAPVTGQTTVSADGLTVSFTPDVPLDPGTSYTITLASCAGDVDLSFTTVGGNPTVPLHEAVHQKTYAVNPNSLNLVKPEGLGLVMSQLLPQMTYLLGWRPTRRASR